MYAPAQLAKAFYTTLAADAQLVALVPDGIFNGYAVTQFGNQDGDFKIVTIGTWSSVSSDDMSTDGWQVSCDVDIWVRIKGNDGYGPNYAIASRIFDLIHRQQAGLSLLMPDSVCWLIRRTGERNSLDPDGLTTRTTLTFTASLKEDKQWL